MSSPALPTGKVAEPWPFGPVEVGSARHRAGSHGDVDASEVPAARARPRTRSNARERTRGRADTRVVIKRDGGHHHHMRPRGVTKKVIIKRGPHHHRRGVRKVIIHRR